MARLQKECPVCLKPADEKSRTLLPAPLNINIINLKCGHSYTEKLQDKKEWELVETFPEYGPVYKLFGYQGEGYEFARTANFRVLIGDEPGLGKTAQADVCVRLHSDELLPCLLICKSALKLQQMRQLIKWGGPDLMPQIITSSKDKLTRIFNVVIATYDILWRIQKDRNKKRFEAEEKLRQSLGLTEWDIIPEAYESELPPIQNPFQEYGFKCVILDECQQIKNPNSKRAQQVREVCKNVPHIIATSGSPIENNAGEYFTILNILKPERFRNYKDYVLNYCDYYMGAYGYKIGGIRDMDRFREQTSDFIIRRKMKDVQKDIPDIFRQFVSCDFASEKLQKDYQRLQQEFSDYFYEHQGDDDYQSNILAMMAKMRHLAGKNKIPFAVDYIVDLINDTNKKFVLFYHHDDVKDLLNLSLIKEFQQMRDKSSEIENPTLYTGEMNPQQRDKAVTEFMENPNCRIFIGSTLASGEGLDGLQRVAEDCIILERQWNPKKEEQAERRVQRIGAVNTGEVEKKIIAHYILSDGTIDEYFTELVEIKRANVNQALDGEESNWNESSLMKELAEVLARKGSKKWKLKK